MNNKGQALIEFVLILPIFMAILFVTFDISKIMLERNILENDSNDIIELYKKDNSLENIKNKYKDIDVKKSNEGNYITLKLEKKVDIITPGLNIILDDPFIINVERTFIYE